MSGAKQEKETTTTTTQTASNYERHGKKNCTMNECECHSQWISPFVQWSVKKQCVDLEHMKYTNVFFLKKKIEFTSCYGITPYGFEFWILNESGAIPSNAIQ